MRESSQVLRDAEPEVTNARVEPGLHLEHGPGAGVLDGEARPAGAIGWWTDFFGRVATHDEGKSTQKFIVSSKFGPFHSVMVGALY